MSLTFAGCRERISDQVAQDVAPTHADQSFVNPIDDQAASEEPTLNVASAEITVGEWAEVGEDAAVDLEIDALIAPYREKLQAVMEEEIGVAQAVLERGRPESPLGNLIADTILHHAQNKIDPETDFALMNRGGIRLPQLPAGAITVADIYQLVPFDNRIVVLTLKGDQIETLLGSLAAQGGELLAGITYQIQNASDAENETAAATNIRVGDAPLDPEAIYKLATLDYLAGIGGEFAVLQQASSRQDGELFLREVMIDRIRELKTIEPVLDGRVSFTDGSED